MSLDKMCCVPHCGRTRQDDVILHSFPHPDKEPDKFRTWLYAIGGDILALDNKKIYKCRKVCHEHFMERHRTYTRRLSANAVPTLKLPVFSIKRPISEISSEATTANITSTSASDQQKPSTSKDNEKKCHAEKIQDEHSYFKTGRGFTSAPVIQEDVERFQPNDNKKQLAQERVSAGNNTNVTADSENDQPLMTFPSTKSDKPLLRCTYGNKATKHVKVKSMKEMNDDTELPTHSPKYTHEGGNSDEYGGTEMEMSMYDDDDDVQLIEKPLLQSTEQLADKSNVHEGIACNVCEKEIYGFRYVCVECGDWDLCQQCEARAAHPQHYVLRVPHSRDEEEIQRVIEAVRLSVRQRTCYDLIPLQLEVTREEGGETYIAELDEDNKDDIDLDLALNDDHQSPPKLPIDQPATIQQPVDPLESQDDVSQPIVTPEENSTITLGDDHYPAETNEVLQSSVCSHEEVPGPSVYCKRVTSQLAPSIERLQTTDMDNEVLQSSVGSEVEMYCERVTSHTTPITSRLAPSIESPQTTCTESSPDPEYFNITNMDTAGLYQHLDKLFGIATVKLKRLPARCLQSTKRRRTSAQYNENETDAETISDSDYEEYEVLKSDLEMQSDAL